MAQKKRINLALQGGGAHGAFTWGVLDRLLEEEQIEIIGISGTSAGALNGAALKSGLVAGGAEAAQRKLREVWEEIGAFKDQNLAKWLDLFSPPTAMMSGALELNPGFLSAEIASRLFSPYGSGPGYLNPLGQVVSQLSYENVCADCDPRLFICATNVRSGKIKIFQKNEVTPDAIMASACLPTLFRAVEIDGESYWDGGYTGNPALFPLFAHDLPDDIVIISINPLYRENLPKTAIDIGNRINEISFNSSLLRELRAIDFVRRLIDEGKIAQEQMKKLHIHMIVDDALMTDLSVATKLTPQPVIIHRLFEAGRRAAAQFIDDSFDKIGLESSIDLRAMFE